MHKDYFSHRVKIARQSVLHGWSILHEDNFAQNNTTLKYLSKNFKECLFTIEKIKLKIDKSIFFLILIIF